MQVGVLALQGGFEPHLDVLRSLGVAARAVRTPRELAELTHLVLPGGESTTLHHLLTLFGMWELLRARHAAGELVVFGTCAGAILIGRAATDGARPPRLGLLDVALERNAYGRQVDSFRAELERTEPGSSPPLSRRRQRVAERLRAKAVETSQAPLPAVFIRAPRIVSVGPSVRVLARHGADPVLVEGPGALAATFHPELSGDSRVHQRFLALAPSAAVVS